MHVNRAVFNQVKSGESVGLGKLQGLLAKAPNATKVVESVGTRIYCCYDAVSRRLEIIIRVRWNIQSISSLGVTD